MERSADITQADELIDGLESEYAIAARGYDAPIDAAPAEQGAPRGLADGLKQGRTQGIAEAYADANAKNAAYFRRMKEALERGEDFDEPPPTFGDKQD